MTAGGIQLHLGIDLVLQIDLLLQQLLKELFGIVVGRGILLLRGGLATKCASVGDHASSRRGRLGGIGRILGGEEVGGGSSSSGGSRLAQMVLMIQKILVDLVGRDGIICIACRAGHLVDISSSGTVDIDIGTGIGDGSDVVVVIAEVEHLAGTADAAAEVVLVKDEAHSWCTCWRERDCRRQR